MLGNTSLVIVMLGYVVSLAGDFTRAEFNLKVSWEDFIDNSTLGFVLCCLRNAKN